jgi:hypothetical protein
MNLEENMKIKRFKFALRSFKFDYKNFKSVKGLSLIGAGSVYKKAIVFKQQANKIQAGMFC